MGTALLLHAAHLCVGITITAGLVPVLPVCSVPIVFEKEFAVP